MMKVRFKVKPDEICTSSRFEVSTLTDVLVFSPEEPLGDVPQRELDVFLESKGEWKDMREAFSDHDLITDNYNTMFFEPRNEEDRTRGYAL